MEAIEVGGLVVHTGTVSHPLLGRAHVIEHAGVPVTAMSAIDWDAPAQIPTIAEPGRLPPGSGTLLMNELALRAQAAAIRTLRYAGPYPTHALFASLLRSFRANGTVEQFTANVLDRATRLATDEVPVDFVPAPFTRHGDVDVRDDVVERIRIAGVTYDIEEQPGSLARLLEDRAVITVGVPIALVARLEGGRIVDGPHPIPPFVTAANGQRFPQALVDEVAELAAAYVTPPIAADVSRMIRERPTTWQDLGHRAARSRDGELALHVGLLVLAKDDMATFAERVSYHLAMIAQQTVLAELEAARRR